RPTARTPRPPKAKRSSAPDGRGFGPAGRARGVRRSSLRARHPAFGGKPPAIPFSSHRFEPFRSMHFTAIFIRRPVLASVVSLFILLAGWQSIRSLTVRQYPRTDNAVVTVSVAYPGANADLVRGFVTTPLEREIASADGIDYV